MLMSVEELARVWALRPQGVLHVGAHEAEEALDYESHGWLPVIWIEAQPNLVKNLQERLDPEFHRVIKAAVWDKDGLEMKFNLASNSQSSSLLSFGTHAHDYPEVSYTNQFQVVTQRLDSILKPYQVPNFLNLDIQGAEGMAIKSLGKELENVEAIYTEINRKEVYLGCIMVEELDVLLKVQGFKRVATRWVMGRGWGDALYLRSSVHQINTTQKVQNILLNSKHVAVQFNGVTKRTIKVAIGRLFSIIKNQSQANGDRL